MQWARDRKEKCASFDELLYLCLYLTGLLLSIGYAKIRKESVEYLALYLGEVYSIFCFCREKYLSYT